MIENGSNFEIGPDHSGIVRIAGVGTSSHMTREQPGGYVSIGKFEIPASYVR
jgi:hypothetical protein